MAPNRRRNPMTEHMVRYLSARVRNSNIMPMSSMAMKELAFATGSSNIMIVSGTGILKMTTSNISM